MRQQETKSHIFRRLRPTLLWLAALCVILMVASGCAPQIGDACEVNDDCPEGATCNLTTEDGFCTIEDCRPGDCPSESVCVEFSRHEAFCLRSCDEDGDCRDEHACIDDQEHDKQYCFVED